MSVPIRNEFIKALMQFPMPQGRQLSFLREHEEAPDRALTAQRLAKAAKYKDYRGIFNTVCWHDESVMRLVEITKRFRSLWLSVDRNR